MFLKQETKSSVHYYYAYTDLNIHVMYICECVFCVYALNPIQRYIYIYIHIYIYMHTHTLASEPSTLTIQSYVSTLTTKHSTLNHSPLHTQTHTQTHTHKHTHTLTQILIHIHMHVHMHIHTHVHGVRICRAREMLAAHVHAHGAWAWGACMCMLMDTAGMCWWRV